MKVITTVEEARKLVRENRQKNASIGLVPTMGYFHEGHLTLMRQARKQCDFVIVSLFVNPTQFGPGEDFETYPRDLNRDADMAAEEGVDAVFAPATAEMYGNGFSTFVEVTGLTEVMCGKFRPGHFRGVTTVVSKLFNIVQPDKAFFGQKDGQQSLVIKRMVKDLNLPLAIEIVPTVRETDGLAMSSRNIYLNPQERRAAVVLYRSLCRGKELIEEGKNDAGQILEAIKQILAAEPLANVEYLEIRDQETLSPLEEIKGKIIMAMAVRIGKTRLIDNFMLEV